MRSSRSPSADRRRFGGGLLAALALGLRPAGARAEALPEAEARALRLRAIVVDVQPLLAKGLGPPTTDLIRQALAAELGQAFADRLAPGARGAPTLVVRISAVSLSGGYAGGGGGRFGRDGGGGTDYLEGAGLLVAAPGGAPFARYPMLSAVPSSSGGAWYDPASERRRVAALCSHYAGWLRRKIAG